jgi:ankyrin repeat protein
MHTNYDRFNLFKLFENKKSDVITQVDLDTALFRAISDNDVYLVELLLSAGASPNAIETHTLLSPLQSAVLINSLILTRLFVKIDEVDINYCDSLNYDALTHALSNPVLNIHIINCILGSDRLDINKNIDGESILHIALNRRLNTSEDYIIIDAIQKILSIPAFKHVKNFEGELPLHIVIKNNDLKVLRFFMELPNFKDLCNVKNNDSKTPVDLSRNNPRLYEILKLAQLGMFNGNKKEPLLEYE